MTQALPLGDEGLATPQLALPFVKIYLDAFAIVDIRQKHMP